MDKLSNDWRVQYLPVVSRLHQNKKKIRPMEPFLCKKCNKVWQIFYGESRSVDYLVDFPKIGCFIKTCKPCNKIVSDK